MDISLDLQSGTPITRQIFEQFRLGIVAQLLSPGDQLPTVRALAERLGVNFNTVARSYRQLEDMGLISTQQGRGTYVLALQSTEAREQIRQASFDSIGDRYLADSRRLGFLKSQAIANLRKRPA